jgi:oxygen-dependent protoporphyrinogen oxidase
VSPDLDVAVVGAGVAGLAVADALRRAGRSVQVFEAADQVGGRMATLRHGGYRIDTGAEQIPTHGYRATWELVRELAIPLAEIPRVGGRVGVWRDGRAHPGVAHPLALVTGAGLSPRARLDLLRFVGRVARQRRAFDPDHPERTPLGEATVAQLAARYHPDLGRYLFQPVVGCFFGWDAHRSAAAPFVSLMAAVGPSTSWRTYRDGMDTLARRLAERLDVRTGWPVREVVAGRDSARLVADCATLTARSVVLCVPAPVARALYPNAPAAERAYLDACTFTPMLRVSLLLDRPVSPAGPPLHVLIVPAVEDGVLAGVAIDHVKDPGRVPPGAGLVSLIAAPGVAPEMLEAPDAEVVRRLSGPAERYLPGLAAATIGTFVHRFRDGLPEATPAALRLRNGFARRPTGPVDYAGDWVMLRPSSEGAVRAAHLAAARILAQQPVRLHRREPA